MTRLKCLVLDSFRLPLVGGSNLPLRWCADVMHGLYHGFGVVLVSQISATVLVFKSSSHLPRGVQYAVHAPLLRALWNKMELDWL